MSKAKWNRNLENNPNLKRWYDSMCKKSKVRAGVYFRSLCRFCENYAKMTPSQFVGLTRRKMEDVTMDFVTQMESSISLKTKKPYAPSYIEGYVKAVSSWARWNSKKFERQITIKNINLRPVASSERVPTQDELRRVLYADTTPLRTRLIIALIAFSGARFKSYGDYEGLDGIKIKDFPELTIAKDEETGKQKEVNFAKAPTQIIIRFNLSKSGLEYRTFLAEEGMEILKQYLDHRIQSGEVLTPESGIIVTCNEDRKRLLIPHNRLEVEDTSPFICSGKVGDLVRQAMRPAGLPWRPYIFRSYFDSALATTEQKGWVTHAFQQFFMGHVGDIEAVYTLNKQQLPESMIEEMREAYRKCQALLQTRVTQGDMVTEERARNMVKISWFQALGFTDKEIEEQKLLEKEGEEIQALVKSKVLGSLNGGKKQKIIQPDDIDGALEEGFAFKTQLPDGRLIVEIAG